MESSYCNRNEVDKNFHFERECQPFADAYYKSRGCTIHRVQGERNKQYDVVLTGGSIVTTVEEKFLRKNAGIMFVEIEQDTETNDPGWIEYTKADRLLYMMPSRAFFCLMPNLKKFIRYFGEHYPLVYCTKGYGRTSNRCIPFSVILENEIGVDIGNLRKNAHSPVSKHVHNLFDSL